MEFSKGLRNAAAGVSLAGAAMGLSGCGNPWVDPVRAKALAEVDQLKEDQTQTRILERQAAALERIADRLEKMPPLPKP